MWKQHKILLLQSNSVLTVITITRNSAWSFSLIGMLLTMSVRRLFSKGRQKFSRGGGKNILFAQKTYWPAKGARAPLAPPPPDAHAIHRNLGNETQTCPSLTCHVTIPYPCPNNVVGVIMKSINIERIGSGKFDFGRSGILGWIGSGKLDNHSESSLGTEW